MVTALAAVPALAANTHFIGTPTFRDLGTQLQVTGKIAGIGNEPFRLVVSAEGIASVECFNPAQTRKESGGPVPGQSQELTLTGTSPVLQADKNGNFTIRAGQLLTAPPTVSSDACPNTKWTPVVTDVAFDLTTVQIFLEQPLGAPLVQIYP
jgi:hypothetical protein